MSWSALIGAFIGAGIPAGLAYVKLLRDRQMTDANAYGPALLLLDQMDPIRVTMNVGTPEVEAERWKAFTQQVDAARERLLVVSAGHPRPDIRELAEQAAVKLADVRNASSWAVSDLLRNRDNAEWMDTARKTHAEARQALRNLIEATFTVKLARLRLTRVPKPRP